jgi:hypothetical protein
MTTCVVLTEHFFRGLHDGCFELHQKNHVQHERLYIPTTRLATHHLPCLCISVRKLREFWHVHGGIRRHQ